MDFNQIDHDALLYADANAHMTRDADMLHCLHCNTLISTNDYEASAGLCDFCREQESKGNDTENMLLPEDDRDASYDR